MRSIIKKVLDEQNWKYLEGDNIFKLDVEGENSTWSSFIRIEDEDSVSYYSVLPVKVEENQIEAMSSLLLKLNYMLKVGSFEINLADGNDSARGQIMLKTYAIVAKDLAENSPEAAQEIVSKAIAFNMLTMDHYSKLLMKAIYSEQINFEDFFNNTERGEQI